MRVPISLLDLAAGSGFTRLAKHLKRDWPGNEPIRLSEAQNLLARCLGYVDYYDVRSAAEHQGNLDYPPLGEVMSVCLMTIWSELFSSGRCNVFNLGELQAQIYAWPFLQLSVYRDHYGHSDNRIVGQAVKAGQVEAFLATQSPRPAYESNDFTGYLSTKELQAMLEGHPVKLT